MKTYETAELVGSEKQIKWADSIRAEKLLQLRQVRITSIAAADAAVRAGKGTAEQAAAGLVEFDRLAEKVTGQTAAKWWIDNRFEHVEVLMQSVAMAGRLNRFR